MVTLQKPAADQRATFRNPLKPDGPDPWFAYYNGWYYFSTTGGPNLQMRRARRLAELNDAPDTVVRQDDAPSMSKNMWAPEFDLLESGHGKRWYLYYTASDDVDNHHRMYVAESKGTDPRGPYAFRSELRTDPNDEYYAIDGTVLKMANGALYFIWCGRPSAAGQGLYISRMANPWTLVGERAGIEAGGLGCDVVREGKAGSAYTYRGRSTRAQPFTWNRDGTPNFGVPLSLDTDVPVPSGELPPHQ